MTAHSPEINGQNSPNGHDVTGGPTRVRRRRPDLATLIDVRREMSKVYREMRLKKVECADGTKLTYVLSNIAKLIEAAELVGRIEALEASLGARRQ